MTFLLQLIGLAPPPHDDAAAVIRGFLTTLDRLDAAAAGRMSHEPVPGDLP
jgi:hypothetical protein